MILRSMWRGFCFLYFLVITLSSARSSSKQGLLGELSAEIELGDSCQQICQQINPILLTKLLTEQQRL